MDSSNDVRTAYRALITTLSDGEAAAFMACFSQEPGALLIGTAPDEWFAGRAAIEQVAQRVLPAIRRAGLTFQPGDVQATCAGAMGWVADRLTLRAPAGQVQELRVLAVFRLEDGRWKVTAYSHSIGIPDDEVGVFHSLAAADNQEYCLDQNG
jgi:ketosteroid isomerase-like protein